MEKLNWGILGSGQIAREMGTALKAVNGEIYAVSSANFSHAKAYGEELGVRHVYQTTEELLADPKVDIAYIATPHNLHHKLILQSLLAGKHVFCEKAITVNSRQLKECVKLADEKGLALCDGVTLFHMPLYKKLKEIVASGAIGRVKMVQGNFGSCKEYDVKNRFFSKELAGGALLDIGVYAVSFARYFMSQKPDTVLTTANYFETGVDETSGILLKNPDGEMAGIALTLRAKQPKRGVIAGEEGYIEIENYPRADRAKIVYTKDGRTETVSAGDTNDALLYEAEDMQAYVAGIRARQKGCPDRCKNTDGSYETNLNYICDVMDTLSAIRNQWGMVYPFEA